MSKAKTFSCDHPDYDAAIKQDYEAQRTAREVEGTALRLSGNYFNDDATAYLIAERVYLEPRRKTPTVARGAKASEKFAEWLEHNEWSYPEEEK